MSAWQATSPDHLSSADWDAWDALHRQEPSLDSPFFHAELTRRVASVRPDVEIATLREDGRSIGFFPFQRDSHDRAHAVTGRLSECHGAVVEGWRTWSPDDLIKACGVASWHFDHLPFSQLAFGGHVWGWSTSPYLDLTAGYAHYRQHLKGRGTSLSQAERKARKLEREIGPLRLEFHTHAPEVFASLVDWKRAQYERTNRLDIFTHAWVIDLLETLRQTDLPDFGGPLSALYAGDQLVAVHLGLRSRRALHMWFPAYNVAFQQFSPGVVLLLQLAEACAERGLARIDLGPGDERYKQNFKTGDITIAQGIVSNEVIRRAVHHMWYRTTQCIRGSRWRQQLEIPLLATNRFRKALAFH